MPETNFSGIEQSGLDDNPLIIRRLYITPGQNSQDQPETIGENEVSVLQNSTISSRGLSKTRPGYALIANDLGSNRIVGLQNFYPEGGTRQLLCVTGQTWNTWSGSGSWSALTLPITLTNDLISSIIVAGNRAFLFNGTDNVLSYDGTTVTDEGNTNTDPPRSRFGIYHQNRLIVSGNSTNVSYLWFSNVLATQTWDRSTNVLKISDQDNEAITSIVDLSLTTSQGFIVFKTRSTYFVDSSDISPANWSIIPIDKNHGCFATRTAVSVGSSVGAGDVIYVSREGEKFRVRSLRRTLADSIETGGILSGSIEDILDDVSDSNMVNACAFFFDDKYFLSIPSGSSTSNDTVLVLDLKVSNPQVNDWKWSVWDGLNSNCFSIFEESGTEYLYFGESTSDSKVYRIRPSTLSDNGVAIEFIQEGRREDFGLPELDKNFEHVETYFLAGDNTEVDIEAQLDGGGFTNIGMVNLTTNAPTLPVNLSFFLAPSFVKRKKSPLDNLGIGRNIQIRVTHSDAGKVINYLGYTLVAFPVPLNLGDR